MNTFIEIILLMIVEQLSVTDKSMHKWVQNQFNVITNLRTNKRLSVFKLTGLNILGRVGTHIFF